MRGTYTRGQQNRGQAALNKTKLEKSKALVGKTIKDGVVDLVLVEPDYVTGEILARLPSGKLRAYHPDRAEELLKKS